MTQATYSPRTNWFLLVAVLGAIVGAWAGLYVLSALLDPELPLTSESYLRQVGQAAYLYADEYGEGHLPDSFATLVRMNPWTTPEMFASPQGPATPAPDFETMLREPGHISYVWIGAGLKMGSIKPDTPLVYEGPVTNFEAGTLVFFADHSIRTVRGEELRSMLRAAEERLGKAATQHVEH